MDDFFVKRTSELARPPARLLSLLVCHRLTGIYWYEFMHPKWFSCLENQTIKPFHRDCIQRIFNRFCWKITFLAPFFVGWFRKYFRVGNAALMLTLHEALGDKFTTMLEVPRGSRWDESDAGNHPRWTDGPSLRLGKKPILEVWGFVFFVWNQEICLWKRGIILF